MFPSQLRNNCDYLGNNYIEVGENISPKQRFDKAKDRSKSFRHKKM